MRVAAVLASVGGFLGMSGIATTAVDFDTSDPWFSLGLLWTGVGAVGVLVSVVVSKRTRIFRAFDVGYRSGFEDGRRVGRPGVVVDLDSRRG